MALYFTSKSGKTVNWNTCQILPDRDWRKTVDEVQADGDELELIKNLFTNIPGVKGRRVVIWTGDIACFIAMNLGLS